VIAARVAFGHRERRRAERRGAALKAVISTGGLHDTTPERAR
jgi:hypothetical protein